jgi:hypothetical protein
LRRFPPEMAARMARFGGQNGGDQGSANPAGGQNKPPTPAPGVAPANGAAGGPGGGFRRGGGDFDAMLERLPPLTLAELKKGDMIAVSSTKGADPGRVTAIKLLAGIEAFMTAPAGPSRVGGGAQAPSMNLPGLDGIGSP